MIAKFDMLRKCWYPVCVGQAAAMWVVSPLGSNLLLSMTEGQKDKYVKDINYEARIMELPMQDEDFRMVILVPNEVDLLNTLFRRLTNEGLAASFASVQPLFSVNSIFRPPNISIKSQTAFSLEKESQGKFQQESLIQYGAIGIDSDSVRANVLSCFRSSESKSSETNIQKVPKEEKPFFFAITFNDTPIFIGQYVPKD